MPMSSYPKPVQKTIFPRAPQCRLTLLTLALLTFLVGLSFSGIGGAVAGILKMELFAFVSTLMLLLLKSLLRAKLWQAFHSLTCRG